MEKELKNNDASNVSYLKENFKDHKEVADVLIRVQWTNSTDIKILSVGDTKEMGHKLSNVFNFLSRIIKNQKKLLDYNSYYVSFLLGQLSEKEFENISEDFIDEIKTIEPNLLKEKISLLYYTLGSDLSYKDIAYYLQCNEDDIDKSLNLIKR